MNEIYSEFKKKDVIDVCSGKKLGRVKDFSFSFPEGKIIKLCVSPKIIAIFGCEYIELPFYTIEKIGDDAILVNPKVKKTEESCCGEEKPDDEYE